MQERVKTDTRTFRFGLDTLVWLADAARHAEVSVNEIVNKALRRRLIVDPLIPTFHGISLDSGTMNCLLAAANRNALEMGASDFAQRDVPAALRLYKTRHRPLEFRDFLTMVLAEAGQWFNVEGSDNGTHQLTLHHTYGLKWSRYVKSYTTSAYSTISRKNLNIEIDEQFIQIDFPSL